MRQYKRKDYPASWGSPTPQMKMKKRVMGAFDGTSRLWKDDMMLSTDYEVRIPLSNNKSYVTDLDVQTLKRAEAFLNATEEEGQYAAQRENYDSEHRRASAPYPSVDRNYNRNQYQQRPPVLQPPVNLAPLKMPPLEPKYETLSSPAGPLSMAGRMAPSVPSPSYQERPATYGQYPAPAPAPAVHELARSGKRPFDTVFGSASFTQPLHNGIRPTSSHQQ